MLRKPNLGLMLKRAPGTLELVANVQSSHHLVTWEGEMNFQISNFFLLVHVFCPKKALLLGNPCRPKGGQELDEHVRTMLFLVQGNLVAVVPEYTCLQGVRVPGINRPLWWCLGIPHPKPYRPVATLNFRIALRHTVFPFSSLAGCAELRKQKGKRREKEKLTFESKMTLWLSKSCLWVDMLSEGG